MRELDATKRTKVMNVLIDDLAKREADAAAELRMAMGGPTTAPKVVVPTDAWNADRLNSFLEEMDGAISVGQHERAVSLAYTCLEGFYRAFAAGHGVNATSPEIIALSRWIRDHLKATIKDYPEEILNLINHTSHAVDRARNRFSEAHFGGEAGRWLAIYVRDLVNTQIRLLLQFM